MSAASAAPSPCQEQMMTGRMTGDGRIGRLLAATSIVSRCGSCLLVTGELRLCYQWPMVAPEASSAKRRRRSLEAGWDTELW